MTRNFAGAVILAAVLGIGVGAGAAYYQARPAPRVEAAARGAASIPGKPGGFGGGATIENVDGSKATVRTGNGSTVDVPLASATLQKQEKIALADLKVGDKVVFRGEQSGEIRNLQVVPSSPRSIAKIDGSSLTVDGPSGSPATIKLASDAQIEKVVPAQASDLKAGQSVQLQRPQSGGQTVLTITSGS